MLGIGCQTKAASMKGMKGMKGMKQKTKEAGWTKRNKEVINSSFFLFSFSFNRDSTFCLFLSLMARTQR